MELMREQNVVIEIERVSPAGQYKVRIFGLDDGTAREISLDELQTLTVRTAGPFQIGWEPVKK